MPGPQPHNVTPCLPACRHFDATQPIPQLVTPPSPSAGSATEASTSAGDGLSSRSSGSGSSARGGPGAQSPLQCGLSCHLAWLSASARAEHRHRGKALLPARKGVLLVQLHSRQALRRAAVWPVQKICHIGRIKTCLSLWSSCCGQQAAGRMLLHPLRLGKQQSWPVVQALELASTWGGMSVERLPSCSDAPAVHGTHPVGGVVPVSSDRPVFGCLVR